MTEYRYDVSYLAPGGGEANVSFLSARPITDPADLSGPTGDDLAYVRGRVRDEGAPDAVITAVQVRASNHAFGRPA